MEFVLKHLHPVKIKEIKPIGNGDRVCLDMMSNFKSGHGLLVGSYNRSLFLIHCETMPNQFVSKRPARVNAGPVSMYVLCSNFTTKYLNELKPGDALFTVDSKGKTSVNTVARSKIEPRPMLLIRGTHRIRGSVIFKLLYSEGQDYFNGYRSIFHLKERKTGKPISVLDVEKYRNKQTNICADLDVETIVQDAETVPLVCRDGRPKSMKQLKPGDRIMAYIQNPELQSRHFGMAYEGFCLER